MGTMKKFEKILKAVANRRKLTIIKFLKSHREATVGEIAEVIRLSFKATSKHLAILSSVEIVDREQRSLQMFYRLASSQVPIAKHLIALL